LLRSRLLHDSIRAGEDKSLMPVLKANEEGWTAVRSSYLDNLSSVLGRSDLLAMNVQPVADLGLHRILLSGCLSVSNRFLYSLPRAAARRKPCLADDR
jgi:hypothetical protein